MRQLLLLSNSRNPGEGYLEHARAWLEEILDGVQTVTFVPWAGVTVAWDDYERMTADAFAGIGRSVRSVHHTADPAAALRDAEAIAVGGGNTFHLLRRLRETGSIEAVRGRVTEGAPYIGWSAGSNVASPTIRTTNDMPIVDPGGFDALGLVPWQINPHYTTGRIPNHGGESRDDRLAEFLTANPEADVVALPEGTAIQVKENRYTLLGACSGHRFRYGVPAVELPPGPVAIG